VSASTFWSRSYKNTVARTLFAETVLRTVSENSANAHRTQRIDTNIYPLLKNLFTFKHLKNVRRKTAGSYN
jgi:hypothetical protein